ncbi:MAG: peptidylprolyl isomerase [Marinifilaceae bacterium]
MKRAYLLLVVLLYVLFTHTSCTQPQKMPVVTIHTNYGTIKVTLYNETPLHRDNFLKITRDGVLDSVLFHRVIKNFMIQGGDPTSKHATDTAKLGDGDLGYTVPAELVYPQLYHKRGALAAAREGNEVNPLRASSASQFYIVTGKVFKNDEFLSMINRKNAILHNSLFHQLMEQNKLLFQQMEQIGDTNGVLKLHSKIKEQAADTLFLFPKEHKHYYQTVGGTPHLDGEYTVFGEVIEGMEVVDSIQNCEVDKNDRPVNEVRILKVEIEN